MEVVKSIEKQKKHRSEKQIEWAKKLGELSRQNKRKDIAADKQLQQIQKPTFSPGRVLPICGVVIVAVGGFLIYRYRLPKQELKTNTTAIEKKQITPKYFEME